MTPREEIDRRVEIARALLREHRADLAPSAYFADRVIARLRESETWVFAWAARRVLPVTLALAAVLTVAIVATHGVSGRAAPASTVSESQRANDPLDWLLDGREELR